MIISIQSVILAFRKQFFLLVLECMDNPVCLWHYVSDIESCACTIMCNWGTRDEGQAYLEVSFTPFFHFILVHIVFSFLILVYYIDTAKLAVLKLPTKE